jgi:hypothetical protein
VIESKLRVDISPYPQFFMHVYIISIIYFNDIPINFEHIMAIKKCGVIFLLFFRKGNLKGGSWTHVVIVG